jgi:hypothetical protein
MGVEHNGVSARSQASNWLARPPTADFGGDFVLLLSTLDNLQHKLNAIGDFITSIDLIRLSRLIQSAA